MEFDKETVKVVVFQLGDEEYGVDVHQVISIERMEEMTRVPNTPDFVKGVINLRGVVTPIIDLHERFSLEGTTYTDRTRIVIVSVDNMNVGLIVDSANDVIDIPTDLIEPPPEVIGVVRAEYLHGVAKLEDRLLILLHLNKVLSTDEVTEIKQIEAE